MLLFDFYNLESFIRGKRLLIEHKYFPVNAQTKVESNSNILGHKEQEQMRKIMERSIYLAKGTESELAKPHQVYLYLLGMP